MMLLRDILCAKGGKVLSISPNAVLSDAIRELVENNCGSLVVCENDKMVGIITERDILRTLATARVSLDQIQVRERMTRDVVTGHPEDSVATIMGIMTDHRVRHLPVLKDNQLVGVVSMGDIVKAQYVELTVENHYLMTYIQS